MKPRKIRRGLKHVAHALGILAPDLDRAQNRWEHFHHRAHVQHQRGVGADVRSAHHEKAGHPVRARYWAGVAARSHHRANVAHGRAIYWIGIVKRLAARRNGLLKTRHELKEDLNAWLKKHGVRVEGNRAIGGTVEQRLVALAKASAAHWAATGDRYYSQGGRWEMRYPVTGPPWGCRDDCSSWFTSTYWGAGAADPNGANYSGGYTGTLASHGHVVSSPQPGGSVLFGYFPFHHVELTLGGIDTIGHGTAAVDHGSTSMLPGARQFRAYA